MKDVQIACFVLFAAVIGVVGFLAGRGFIPVPGMDRVVMSNFDGHEENDNGIGGKCFWTPTRGRGGHYYLVVDYPDMIGRRQSSYIHDPSCPCHGRK